MAASCNFGLCLGKTDKNVKERKRNPNWNYAETNCLIQEVSRRRSEVLKCATGLTDLVLREQHRSEAWIKIAASISSLCSSDGRTVNDCKTKLGNVLKDASKKLFRHNLALQQAGIF